MAESRQRDAGSTGHSGARLAALGAGIVALAVVLAAAGDHLVGPAVGPTRLHIYDIANRFQIYQGLGLVALGLSKGQWGAGRLWCVILALMLLGVLAFSGGLYLLAITGKQDWSFFAPVGGTAMILGWTLFAWGLWRRSRQRA